MKSYLIKVLSSYVGSFVLVAFALGASGSANASEAMLKRFFNEVSNLQADFEQIIVDEKGNTVEKKSGVFSFSRPGKFRWNYMADEPDYPLGQQIISDGSLITFYDPDFETATQRSMVNALEQVPTLVLVQSGASLERHFSITDIGETDGRSWVNLKPKDENTSYRGLMVGFTKQSLSAIVFIDGLGNETRLTFDAVRTNTKLQADLFSFTAGPNVDVIRQ